MLHLCSKSIWVGRREGNTTNVRFGGWFMWYTVSEALEPLIQSRSESVSDQSYGFGVNISGHILTALLFQAHVGLIQTSTSRCERRQFIKTEHSLKRTTWSRLEFSFYIVSPLRNLNCQVCTNNLTSLVSAFKRKKQCVKNFPRQHCMMKETLADQENCSCT